MERQTSTEEEQSFQRISSESNLLQDEGSVESEKAKWERSQSSADLKNHSHQSSDGGYISEQSKVYWDLSKAAEDNIQTSSGSSTPGSGKFKISLQTIHQKEEMTMPISIKTRVVRRMQSETALMPNTEGTSKVLEYTLTQPSSSCDEEDDDTSNIPTVTATSNASKTHVFFRVNQQGKPNLSVTLSQAVPILQENIRLLRAPKIQDQCHALNEMLHLIKDAWATPTIGRDLAYGLCDVLYSDGGLDILVENCGSSNYEIQLGSAKVLAESMTVNNRKVLAEKGLQAIVQLAAFDDNEMVKAATGILENLFKNSEETCSKVIKYGGLNSILHSCRTRDGITLQHCAEALANLAMYGGKENQHRMITHNAADWLFPLAFSCDDKIRYYAILAITSLSANKEIESAVVRSGTLDLVTPFITSHDPTEFAKSDTQHIHGQGKEWLRRLVPLLESKREEAQSLAAFHLAMEASIKADQGKPEIFDEIGAIGPLKRVACSTNKIAASLAAKALQIIGESVPYTLSPIVPLWTHTDVKHWLQQIQFNDYLEVFESLQVDGDILLRLTDLQLANDIGMKNGITRARFWRELTKLKISSNYECCDTSNLADWLRDVGKEFCQYTYPMVQSGVDCFTLRVLNEDLLANECTISNGVHRLKLMDAIKRRPYYSDGKLPDEKDGAIFRPIDVFISYRRSNGSQLASLLKVHLQLKGFSVFLDIERLAAGKFDDNLLNSVRNARNFILILTPNSLDRCIGDLEQKDWVHREVVAAINSNCRIIPVMDNFQYPKPEDLPDDMRPICYFNGIRWIHDYQDACVDKLEKFLKGDVSVVKSAARPLMSRGDSAGSLDLLPPSSPHGTLDSS